MALFIDKSAPAGSDVPSTIDNDARSFKTAVEDIFGIPDATTISAAPMTIASAGTVTVNTDWTWSDNIKVTLGTGGDADLYYDGTDVILNVAVAGSGDFYVAGGRVEVDDNEGVAFGTGKDATISYDGTDLVVSPAAVGSGDVVISGGRVEVDDDEGLALGTGNDALINYNGTDLVISPAVVGTGDVYISGGSVEVDDSESVTFGTGKDATIAYDGTDLVISPAAVGSGDIVVSGGSVEFADNEGITLGTGEDAFIRYNGTDLVVDPKAVGSGTMSLLGGITFEDQSTDSAAAGVLQRNGAALSFHDGSAAVAVVAPTGAMMIWTTDTAPNGWLLCYGQEVSRTTYAALFAVVSTTFGIGDGSTTFNLPDMRGRFPLGQDDMGGTSADRASEAEADTIGSAEGDEDGVAAHTHPPLNKSRFIEANTGTWSSWSSTVGGSEQIPSVAATTGSTGDATGGNMPPFLTLNYIIKT